MKIHAQEFSPLLILISVTICSVFYLQVAVFQKLPQDFQGTSRVNELYKYEMLQAITTL